MYPSTSPPRLPFLIHALLETVAAITFIARPETQLASRGPLSPSASASASPSPGRTDSQLILSLLGGLLLSTNLVALVFAARPEVDRTTRLVAASFAYWHLWPCYRAGVRILRALPTPAPAPVPAPAGATAGDTAKTLGGPAVHLGVHLALLILFLRAAWGGGEA